MSKKFSYILFYVFVFCKLLPTVFADRQYYGMDAIVKADTSSGMGGSVIDVKEIDRRVNAFAEIVGEKQFNLIVGGTLLARSAFYGQMDEGQTVTAPRMSVESTDPREHIEVGSVRHEIVPEEHSRQDNSFTIPIGDLFTVMSRLTPREEIAKAITEEGLEDELTHDQLREKKAKAIARLDAEKDRAGKVSDKIDETDKQFVRELETSVSPSEIQAFKEGKPVSAETKQAVRTAAQKAKNTHVRERTTMDLKRSKDVSGNVESQISEGSLNACLGFYDERIGFYDGLLKTLSLETKPTVTHKRRNSFDARVPTTISGMEDTVRDAGSRFMADSRVVRAKGFVKAWESGETVEYLGKTTTSVLVDDVIPVIGRGIQTVDEWTGGRLSTVLSAIDPSNWGTQVRRGLRDGLGTSQRVAQNAGDIVQYAGEVGLMLCSFGGGSAVKGVQTTVKARKIAETTATITKATRLAQFEKTVAENVRPHWTQSERFVGEHLGKTAKSQVSFLEGVEVSRGIAGSVRPDFMLGKVSIEVKNYNLTTNRSNLVRDIVQQAHKRSIHLPKGTIQAVQIDIRGQTVSSVTESIIKQQIERKSGGIITVNNIRFIK